MSWWKYPAQSAAGPASAPGAPVRADIIPDKLAALVYQHQVPSPHGGIACWSYVTDGLAAVGQAEIAFTLRRDPGEAGDGCPDDPLQLFTTIYELAAGGQRVAAGGVTEFGERRFFEHHLVYVAAQPLPGVALPSPCLAALLITADELRAVRSFGVTRVLARMGQASSYYPFPPWSDRRRRGLALERTFDASLLGKMPRMAALDVHVGVTGEQITVTALRAEQPSWQRRLAQLPDGVPIALLTAIDPAADGCMTWVPGQTGPEAIVPPGSAGERVCGCFVVLIAGQPASGGKLLEDGFAMELTAEAWQALRRALIEGSEVAIPASGDAMALALRWRDADAVVVAAAPSAPRASFAYAATAAAAATSGDATAPAAAPVVAGGAPGSTATSGDAAAEPPGKLALGPVRLMTPEDQFAQRASAEELGEFCREIQRCADRLLAGHDGKLELKLQVICRPRSHRVGLSHRGDVPEATLDALIDALEQLPALHVRAEVSFELELTMSAVGPRSALP